jgi:hypothetical protein
MKYLFRNNRIFGLALLIATLGLAPASFAAEPNYSVSYHTVEVDGVNIFYREAGNPAKS